MEEISFKTRDGVNIVANLYSAEKPKGWVLFVHMMPAIKESWNNLALKLQALGYEGLAIDLRGHGKSDGGPQGYFEFDDSDHQASILDIEAAVEYLKSRNALPDRTVLIGASIGANLSLKYAASHPEVKAVILLSAGMNYRGVETESLVKKFRKGPKAFLITSKDDAKKDSPHGTNTEQNEKLFKIFPEDVDKKIHVFETGGHGTTLLKTHSELEGIITKFITG